MALEKFELRDAVKTARRNSGKSLLVCAHEIGISQSYLWAIETGRKKNPTFGVLAAILIYFRIRYTDIEPPGIDD